MSRGTSFLKSLSIDNLLTRLEAKKAVPNTLDTTTIGGGGGACLLTCPGVYTFSKLILIDSRGSSCLSGTLGGWSRLSFLWSSAVSGSTSVDVDVDVGTGGASLFFCFFLLSLCRLPIVLGNCGARLSELLQE